MARELSDHSNDTGNDVPRSGSFGHGASRRGSSIAGPTRDRRAPEGRALRWHALASRTLPEAAQRAREGVRRFLNDGPVRRGLWRVALAMERHRAGRSANAMAFDLFLALIPMLALAGWALTHFISAGPAALEASSLLADLTPDQLGGIIRNHFQSLSAATLAPVAAVSGWWLASSAFHTMIGVFEEAFDCKRRPWWQSRLLALGYALAGMAVLALSGVLGVLLTRPPAIVQELMSQLRSYGLLRAALATMGVLVMSTFFALLYGIAIQRPGVERRRVWPGAVLAAGLGSGASFLFGYYATQVARFALFYGSLAAVAILLLWLWLWCVAILLGAELNVTLEDRKRRPDSEAVGDR